MAKRRTRKQKATAKHTLSVNWDDLNLKPKQKTRLAEASVKRQIKNGVQEKTLKAALVKNANYKEKDENLGSIKFDLVKSVLISLFIITIEIVLYLVWV